MDDAAVIALRRAASICTRDAAAGLLAAGLAGYAAAVLGCVGWLVRATMELASAGWPD